MMNQPNNLENKKRKINAKKVLLCIAVSFLAILLILSATLFILIKLGKGSLLSNTGIDINTASNVSNTVIEDDGKTVIYKDEVYKYNENMTAVLCMGVDLYGTSHLGMDSVPGNSGQADAIFLYAMDTKTGKSTIIPIPRDTIADVDMYSPEGQYVSSSKKQICLSYAYGDGKHTSCENVVKSVSRLFYGIHINSYVAIDLSAIEVLVNAVNGVSVTPVADGTYGGKTYKAGETVTLDGKQAVAFVQQRSQELGASLERMGRQKVFVQGFFNKALSMTKQDIKTPIRLYNTITKYMITNVNLAKVSYFTSSVIGSGGANMNFSSIKGEMIEGEDGLAEYHANTDSVYETVLDVFYQKEQ